MTSLVHIVEQSYPLNVNHKSQDQQVTSADDDQEIEVEP